MKMVNYKLMFKVSLLAASSLMVQAVMGSKQFFSETRKHPSTSRIGLESTDNFHRRMYKEKRGNMYHPFGYILVNDYFDQITDASRNILSLQCWAGAVSKGLKIVEPFVHKESGFGVSLNFSTQEVEKAGEDSNILRLQDVLYLEGWNDQIRGQGFAPFASWKVFLKSAPRKLIIIPKPCREHVRNSCNGYFNTVASQFAKEHSFDIVRSVHLKNKLYSLDNFRNIIYGDHKPEESVVLFERWGGILPQIRKGRIAISDNNSCSRYSFPNFLFESSPKIVEDNQRYLDQYMPKGDTNYISVMLRTEHFGINHNFREIKSPEEKFSLYSTCIQGIINQVRTMKEFYKTSSVFLTVDCRRFGSRELKNSSDKGLLDTVVEILFRELKSYGMRLSLEEWDASFDEVPSFKTPGYVALLQKNLAASGKCLVTAGGGTFQKSAEMLYKSINNSNNITSQCYKMIQEC